MYVGLLDDQAAQLTHLKQKRSNITLTYNINFDHFRIHRWHYAGIRY